MLSVASDQNMLLSQEDTKQWLSESIVLRLDSCGYLANTSYMRNQP